MRLSDISDKQLVGGGASVERLHRTLERLAGDSGTYTHIAGIAGEKYDALVYATTVFPGGYEMPRAMNSRELAQDTVDRIPKTRYNPPDYPGGGTKGWAISIGRVRDKGVVLMQAMYYVDPT